MKAATRSSSSWSPKYAHHRPALIAIPSATVLIVPASMVWALAPIAIATTDSPIATSTTSAWRSTKCLAPSRRLWSAIRYGDAQAAAAVSAHSAYCQPPPSAPPATITSANATLTGKKPR